MPTSYYAQAPANAFLIMEHERHVLSAKVQSLPETHVIGATARKRREGPGLIKDPAPGKVGYNAYLLVCSLAASAPC